LAVITGPLEYERFARSTRGACEERRMSETARRRDW